MYLSVRNVDDGNYHEVKSDYLRFVLDYNYKKQDQLKYDVLDVKGVSVLNTDPVYQETEPHALPDLPENCFYGENKFILEFPPVLEFEKPYVLILEMNDIKKYLRFKRVL